jgi:hypothetical protein
MDGLNFFFLFELSSRGKKDVVVLVFSPTFKLATKRAGNLHSLCISLSLQFLPFNIIIRLWTSGGEIAVLIKYLSGGLAW